tara:strand:- start:106 stop:321 length:216 start_codon:yes stop_codon:yes gene_type:complete
MSSEFINDPIKIDYYREKYLSKSITDQEYAEHCMYSLVRFYVRYVFKPGTNVQLREFVDVIIKDQMETFND